MRGTGGEDWEQEQAGVSTAERELLTAICNKTKKQNHVYFGLKRMDTKMRV